MIKTQKAESSILNHSRNWEEVYQLISWWNSDKIAEAVVMVVGSGALGNEVLKNLTLLNIGRILIVDFDQIEYSNLSRSILFRENDISQTKAEVAAKRVREINPNVKVKAITGDIAFDVGLGVFRRVDVVIGCLDNRVARLYINRYCYKVGKTWIDGGIMNLSGQLDVFRPGTTCYECQLLDHEWDLIRMREGCSDVAQRNANAGRIPTTPISASIIGAMQVQEALKVLFGNEKESLAGRQLTYYGSDVELLIYYPPELKKNCLSHSTIAPESIVLSELSNKNSIASVINWLKAELKSEKISIILGYEIAREVTGTYSEKTTDIFIPKQWLSEQQIEQLEGIPGEGLRITKSIHTVDDSFPFPEKSLSELGIPPLHILTVETNDDIVFVELGGDDDYFKFD